jgi:energy-dependent translational throttle protein EttA
MKPHHQLSSTQTARDDAKRGKALERELEWMRMSPKARQTKSKARISSYEQMVQADEEAREVGGEL